jgi:hypothetical protein
VNTFRQEKSTVALAIDEAVAMVVVIAQAQAPAEAKLACERVMTDQRGHRGTPA